jgi:hypothetical protein
LIGSAVAELIGHCHTVLAVALRRPQYVRSRQPAVRGSDVVYDAMTSIAKVRADEKFIIVSTHAPGDLVNPKAGYLGINCTSGNCLRCLIIKRVSQ